MGEQQKTLKEQRIERADISGFGSAVKEDELVFYLHKVTEFDRQGNETRSVTCTRNGERTQQAEHRYDDQGRLVFRKEELPKDGVIEEQQFVYDDQGRVVEETISYGDDYFENFKIAYDEKGREVARARYDQEGGLMDIEYNLYHDNGKIARVELHDAEQQLLSSRDYEYDEAGNILREVTVHHTDKTGEMLLHDYDEKGNRVRTRKVNHEGQEENIITMHYDDNGRAVRFVSEAVGHSPSKVVQQTTYDPEGRVTGQEFYDVVNGFLLASEHSKFDEEGRLSSQEIYEIKPNQSTGKNHHILRFQYQFWENP